MHNSVAQSRSVHSSVVQYSTVHSSVVQYSVVQEVVGSTLPGHGFCVSLHILLFMSPSPPAHPSPPVPISPPTVSPPSTERQQLEQHSLTTLCPGHTDMPVFYSTVLCSAVMYSAVLCSAALRCIVFHSTM